MNNKLSTYQNKEGTLKEKQNWGSRTNKRISMINWEDVEGMTVLDLGCNNGQFVLEAARRGAKRAVGIDSSDCIKGARELSEKEGLNAEFWQLDVESKELQRFCPRFDVVIVFSLLTHLKDKVSFVKWLDGIVKYELLFESNCGEKHKNQIELVKDNFYFEKGVDYLGISEVPEMGVHHLWRGLKSNHEIRYPHISDMPVVFIPIDKIEHEIWTKGSISEQKGYYKTEKDIDKLKLDIKKKGIKEPLLVRKERNNKDIYRGVQGGHRFLIAKELGYKELPCKILSALPNCKTS